jgi:hypothetical protein
MPFYHKRVAGWFLRRATGVIQGEGALLAAEVSLTLNRIREQHPC